MTTILADTLNLPRDVQAPDTIQIHGKLTGAYNEVVVIQQLRRQIFGDAHVCHITEGSCGKGIYDMPNFFFIKETSISLIKRIGDTNYTMACVAEALNYRWGQPTGFGRTNWLF